MTIIRMAAMAALLMYMTMVAGSTANSPGKSALPALSGNLHTSVSDL